ncbi:Lrp/AsnC family transcriptional regulator [Corynebacterium glyciniphilum]|uniref:Lrp/AsnC family transcriptional regulator n=1 Tax=Corynebacterium glyciniphilum TaxID=1404244 RepID=UPI0011AB8355|nr:Lrp/AsnC family transcriptional regulator [Corynebacterium glyciniphilum]
MTQEMTLDALDERLVHAVQVAPRAAWAALAPVVGADPVTLARRWAQLRRQGAVYVTGYGWDPDAVFSLIEIECQPGRTMQVAEALVEERGAFTIDLTAGARDIMLSLLTPDTSALAHWTLEHIQELDGVRRVRTHLVSQIVADAREWRLRALSRDEVATITGRTASGRAGAAMPRLAPDELEKAREVVAAMTATERYKVRVDVARSRTPWPVSVWYFLQVPADKVSRVGPLLSKIDEARLVVTATGEYNVIMAAWLRSLLEVNKLEAVLEERLPGVRIVDRSVVLRSLKHLGHVLDDNGDATGRTVPMP